MGLSTARSLVESLSLLPLSHFYDGFQLFMAGQRQALYIFILLAAANSDSAHGLTYLASPPMPSVQPPTLALLIWQFEPLSLSSKVTKSASRSFSKIGLMMRSLSVWMTGTSSFSRGLRAGCGTYDI